MHRQLLIMACYGRLNVLETFLSCLFYRVFNHHEEICIRVLYFQEDHNCHKWKPKNVKIHSRDPNVLILNRITSLYYMCFLGDEFLKLASVALGSVKCLCHWLENAYITSVIHMLFYFLFMCSVFVLVSMMLIYDDKNDLNERKINCLPLKSGDQCMI